MDPEAGSRVIFKMALVGALERALSRITKKKFLTGFFSEDVALNDVNPFLSMISRGFSPEIQPKYKENRVQTRLSSNAQDKFRSQVSFR